MKKQEEEENREEKEKQEGEQPPTEPPFASCVGVNSGEIVVVHRTWETTAPQLDYETRCRLWSPHVVVKW